MLVQVNLGGTDSACCLSQTESGKADVKTAKEGDEEPVKGGVSPPLCRQQTSEGSSPATVP